MSDPILPPEAEALDQYLNGQRITPLPPDEAALVDALKAAAIVEPDLAFATALERQLAMKANGQPQPSKAAAFNPFLWSESMRKFSAFAFTTVLIVGLLIGGVWLSARLQPIEVPNPGGGGTAVVTQVGPDNTNTPQPQPTPTPEPSVTPALELQPGLSFPDGPTGAILYRQIPLTDLTVDKAKQLAAQLGIEGHVYQSSGEGGLSQVIYDVSDGRGNVRFLGSPSYFNLTPDEYTSFVITGEPLPFDQRAAIAEAFLKEAGLLDFDFLLEPSTMNRYAVVVTRLLDGYRLIFDQSGDLNNSVSVSAEGQVQSVLNYMPEFEEVGKYPIISARQAWEALHAASPTRGISMNSSFTMLDENYRIWVPQYLEGETVDLYGYPVVFQSAEAGVPPMISLNNIKIIENTEAMAASIVPGQFTHVWGTYHPNGLQVEGWEAATQADDFLHGTFERVGDTDTAYLNIGEQRYTLNHVLADIPNRTEVEVRGVKVGDEFVWTTINTPTEGGGGGGGGGGPWPEVVLTPVADLPTPTPYVFPYQTGDVVDGVEGTAEVQYIKQPDGSRVMEARLWVSDPTIGAWPMLLQGEAVADIAQYNKLPIRVYGVVTAPNPQGVTVEVEHYEPMYPGLQVQGWRGTQSIETVEGRKVILFTAEDGTKYVSDSSLSMPEESVGSAGIVGYPGDLVTVVGINWPDKSFGGYPVIQEFSIGLATGDEDLATLIAQVAEPGEIEATDASNNSGFLGSSDIYMFEHVELAYLASDFTHGWPPPADDCSCRFVQPVWRFSGHTREGQAFAITVQALVDEYLKPVP